jgi:tetratricopeptide (TPR) repeat protein
MPALTGIGSPHETGDIPRWLDVLDGIAGDDSSKLIICGDREIWPRERLNQRLKYVKHLWEAVNKATEEDLSFDELNERLSLDNEFSYVREFPFYEDSGYRGTVRTHSRNIRDFWARFHTPASSVIEKALADSGIEAAWQELRSMKVDSANEFFFEESSFNALGYTFLREEKVAEAIVVFKMNVELFPDSWNVHDSLGEAYAANGDTEQAIENYRKALELNPGNENIREILRKLGDDLQQ